MVSRKTVNTLLAGVAAITMAGGAITGEAQASEKADKEKCYGVAKAGHNSCPSADKSHSCAGQSTVDGDKNAWIYVPKGLCDKLVGGSTTPPAANDKMMNKETMPMDMDKK